MNKSRTSVMQWIFVAPLAILFACGGDATGSSSLPEDVEKISAGEDNVALPSREGKRVLTISGALSAPRNPLQLDMAAIENLPLYEASVYEPFLKKNMSFRGVMLDELVAAADAEDSASEVRMTALDDYVVSLSLDEINSSPILLATESEGKRIPIEEGGPIRIIFLSDDRSGSNSDMWIWSVTQMKVED